MKKTKSVISEIKSNDTTEPAIYNVAKTTEKDRIIARQLRFQDLLISISNTYINADLVNFDELINKSLKQIGTFVGADRSYIFNYDFINNTTSNTYE